MTQIPELSALWAVVLPMLALLCWKKRLRSLSILCLFICVGTTMNVFVIYANGRKMPVFTNNPVVMGWVLNSKMHVLGNEKTILPLLCDRQELNDFSLGDLISLLALIAFAMHTAYASTWPPDS